MQVASVIYVYELTFLLHTSRSTEYRENILTLKLLVGNRNIGFQLILKFHKVGEKLFKVTQRKKS